MQKKPFRVVALCLLCLLLAALPVAAQEEDWYVEIGRSSTGTYSLYLPSVEVRSDYLGRKYVTGWTRWDFSDAEAEELAVNGVKPYYGMEFWAANTELRQCQEISLIYYDKEGKELDSIEWSFSPNAWDECIPGRNGEAV